MSTLSRVTGKVFAGEAESSQVGQFGSAAAGDPTNTTDVATIQSLPAYGQGWGSAVISNRNYPPLEEVNGVLKSISYQNCYLLQEGVPTYDSGTVYSNTSIVKTISGDDVLFYRSKRDNNIGNQLTNTTWWDKVYFENEYEPNITANRSIALTGAVTGSVSYQLTDSDKYNLNITTAGKSKTIELTGAVTGNATINTGNTATVSISTGIGSTFNSDGISRLFAAMNADFTRGVSKSLNTLYTAETDGFIQWRCDEQDGARNLYINNVVVARTKASGSNDACGTAAFLPVAKGSTYKSDKAGTGTTTLTFYPLKGV